MTDSVPLLVLCTCPDSETAERIAESLVGERLAACVNILPQSTSIYRWQDRVERDEELLLLIKTTQAVYPALEARITALHPYDVPEIIAFSIQHGVAAYLTWLARSTGVPL